jgi:hypothetical protein
MRFRAATFFSLFAAAGALAFAGGARAHSSSAPARSRPTSAVAAAAGSHLQVTEVEYRLLLSTGTVKAGAVDLEAIDRGLDPHDLRLRAAGSAHEIAAPELTSGRSWDGVVRLNPGVYHLWCSLPEHARLGMHTTLRVVR